MFPSFDAHFHLDPEGKGIEAVREFERAGGKGLMLVSKPYLREMRSREDARTEYEILLALAKRAREETGVKVSAALGVHPVRISEFSDIKKGRDVMKEAIDLAVEYIIDGKACAIGEIGRPHYEVSDEVLEASNDVIGYVFERANEIGCAVIVHSESSERTYEELSVMAEKAGMDKRKVVKHFSPIVSETFGLTPSIIARYENARRACDSMKDFMLESDYIDDLRRPGAVIGPKTLPKTANRLLEEGYEDVLYRAMKDLPERVFGIEI